MLLGWDSDGDGHPDQRRMQAGGMHRHVRFRAVEACETVDKMVLTSVEMDAVSALTSLQEMWVPTSAHYMWLSREVRQILAMLVVSVR